jgi:hypothetical protein
MRRRRVVYEEWRCDDGRGGSRWEEGVVGTYVRPVERRMPARKADTGDALAGGYMGRKL